MFPSAACILQNFTKYLTLPCKWKMLSVQLEKLLLTTKLCNSDKINSFQNKCFQAINLQVIKTPNCEQLLPQSTTCKIINWVYTTNFLFYLLVSIKLKPPYSAHSSVWFISTNLLLWCSRKWKVSSSYVILSTHQPVLDECYISFQGIWKLNEREHGIDVWWMTYLAFNFVGGKQASLCLAPGLNRKHEDRLSSIMSPTCRRGWGHC